MHRKISPFQGVFSLLRKFLGIPIEETPEGAEKEPVLLMLHEILGIKAEEVKTRPTIIGLRLGRYRTIKLTGQAIDEIIVPPGWLTQPSRYLLYVDPMNLASVTKAKTKKERKVDAPSEQEKARREAVKADMKVLQDERDSLLEEYYKNWDPSLEPRLSELNDKLFEKRLQLPSTFRVRWVGGELARLLNEDEELNEQLARLEVTDIKIKPYMKKKKAIVLISHLRGTRLDKSYLLCNRIASHIRKITG